MDGHANDPWYQCAAAIVRRCDFEDEEIDEFAAIIEEYFPRSQQIEIVQEGIGEPLPFDFDDFV